MDPDRTIIYIYGWAIRGQMQLAEMCYYIVGMFAMYINYSL